MEKLKHSRIAHYVDKLAVPAEPGLTNAQLMLTNHDLKPGMKYPQPAFFVLSLNFSQLSLSVVNGVLGTLSASGLPIPSTSYVDEVMG